MKIFQRKAHEMIDSMKKRSRWRRSEEFQLEAVELYRITGLSVVHVSEELGVSQSLLYRGEREN